MAEEFRWSKSDVEDCTIDELNYLLSKIDEKNKRINAASKVRKR